MEKNERLLQLVQILADPTPRHVGGPCGSEIEEGLWAAIQIKNNYGVEAIHVLAGSTQYWLMIPLDNLAVVRSLGFPSIESARVMQRTALRHIEVALTGVGYIFNPLRELLTNADRVEWGMGAAAMVTMPTTEGVPDLTQALDDSYQGVRKIALTALHKIRGKKFLFGNEKASKWSRWWAR